MARLPVAGQHEVNADHRQVVGPVRRQTQHPLRHMAEFRLAARIEQHHGQHVIGHHIGRFQGHRLLRRADEALYQVWQGACRVESEQRLAQVDVGQRRQGLGMIGFIHQRHFQSLACQTMSLAGKAFLLLVIEKQRPVGFRQFGDMALTATVDDAMRIEQGRGDPLGNACQHGERRRVGQAQGKLLAPAYPCRRAFE